MSEPRCPKCGKPSDVEVGKIHNPDTLGLEARATLHCKVCQVSWEGLVESPAIKKAREKGWVR